MTYDRLALCRSGEFLAIDDLDAATLWPRAIHPSAEDALAAVAAHDGYEFDAEDRVHLRIVWAIEDNYWPGYWSWFDTEPDDSSVECWEVLA